MSMIRIDDDTFIDDSLVTCAEYQQFIDEMRGQGKYYQPDHWNEHHFPKGQSRKPIFGVRPSDGFAFCIWLTEHQKDGWRYRLPTFTESVENPVLTSYPSLAGYWTMNHEQIEFAWVKVIIKNPRNLHISDIEKDILTHITYNRDHDYAHERENAFNFDRAHDLNIDFDLDHTRTLARYLRSKFDINISHAFALNIDLVHELSRELTLFADHIFDIYVDLYTLRERIAGRSLAFEGIRIVKERNK